MDKYIIQLTRQKSTITIRKCKYDNCVIAKDFIVVDEQKYTANIKLKIFTDQTEHIAI